MYVLRLYRGLKYVKEIPYTKEALEANGFPDNYTHTKLVWKPQPKEVSQEIINSMPGVYKK